METTKTHSMKPTAAILDNIRRSSKKNKEETFTRLFRYLLRPDIYYLAYENLYANNGAATKGVNNDTLLTMNSTRTPTLNWKSPCGWGNWMKENSSRRSMRGR